MTNSAKMNNLRATMREVVLPIITIVREGCPYRFSPCQCGESLFVLENSPREETLQLLSVRCGEPQALLFTYLAAPDLSCGMRDLGS